MPSDRTSSTGHRVFDVEKIRADFPILHTLAHGKPLVYLDNAATTQKPRAVIDRLVRYYETENANIHRGVYELSQKATAAYEDARRTVAKFINAREENEVLFTRGTTEGINLVASTFARSILKPGDDIIVSAIEHHSNIVPWQMIAELTGAKVRVIPMNDLGELILDVYEKLLGPRTKIVSVNHVSNALGTINDVERIVQLAHGVGAKVLIDGAQWVAHHPTDVRQLDCDFYCFSGHKLYGPTGIGVLWGRRELLEQMPPFQGGGDMIESVTFEKTTYAGLPNKFEAGTPDISGAIALAAAIDYVTAIGFDDLIAREDALLKHATQKLGEIPGVRIIGQAKKKAGVVSFVVEKPAISTLDIGMKLDREGIAIRTGHHCCQPIMDRLAISSTARASFAMYNTLGEVDALAAALGQIVEKERLKQAERALPVPPMQPIFPAAAAASPTAAADAIASDLEEIAEVFGGTAAKVEYLENDLSRKLAVIPEAMRHESLRIHGCASRVYLLARSDPQAADRIQFIGWSDSSTVNGLIVVLQRLFSGQRVSDVLGFDVEGFWKRIKLEEIITDKRRIGLTGMTHRIRSTAQALVHDSAHSDLNSNSA